MLDLDNGIIAEISAEIDRVKTAMRKATGAELESLRKDMEILREEYRLEMGWIA